MAHAFARAGDAMWSAKMTVIGKSMTAKQAAFGIASWPIGRLACHHNLGAHRFRGSVEPGPSRIVISAASRTIARDGGRPCRVADSRERVHHITKVRLGPPSRR